MQELWKTWWMPNKWRASNVPVIYIMSNASCFFLQASVMVNWKWKYSSKGCQNETSSFGQLWYFEAFKIEISEHKLVHLLWLLFFKVQVQWPESLRVSVKWLLLKSAGTRVLQLPLAPLLLSLSTSFLLHLSTLDIFPASHYPLDVSVICSCYSYCFFVVGQPSSLHHSGFSNPHRILSFQFSTMLGNLSHLDFRT